MITFDEDDGKGDDLYEGDLAEDIASYAKTKTVTRDVTGSDHPTTTVDIEAMTSVSICYWNVT